MQGSSDQQHNVVDHVPVGDEVHEAGQGPGGVVAHVLELGHQLLPQLVIDDRDLQAALVGQEVAIVSGLEVELEVVQGLALNQVQVVILGQNT